MAKVNSLGQYFLMYKMYRASMHTGGFPSGAEGEKMEAVADFILEDSKITVMVASALKVKDTCFLEGKL